jgi:LacI family transcriptional regulator
MSEIREVALAFPRGAHQEAFIEGVLRYAAEHRCNWSYITAPESLSLSVLDLVGWPGDGILAALNTEAESECAERFRMPVVNISSALAASPAPRAIVDNPAIGVMAAEHLLAKGFREFAFFGLSGVKYSSDRRGGFVTSLQAEGFSCTDFEVAPTFVLGGNLWMEQHRQLAEWLRSLPTPCGLFAVSDYRARQAIDSCRQCGIHVPEQIVVIGVDNERVICEHSNPRLTSVARNDCLEGFRAATMLDQLMRGESLPVRESLTPPLEVIERDSTATFAVEDPRLRDALLYLHQNIEKPITIDHIIEHAGVSRRWLEYAFRRILHESPYQYLRRQRLSLAKRLLNEDPSAKVHRIAQRSGFSSAKQLAIAFQQTFGMSPRDFRKTGRF